MTDFAKSQLMKYGWTEGKGLGKHETGITEPLKLKVKLDTAGIDHKNTDWEEWWETAFNKAANNIIVESQMNGVSISVSNEDTTEELSKNLNEKKSEYMKNYGNFLKSSTLCNGILLNENNSNPFEVEKIKKDFVHVPLTDEELFNVCGGRTVHKGARHGLTLSGKLKRIAQQEKDLLGTNACVNMSYRIQKYDSKYEENQNEIDNNENSLSPIILPLNEELSAPKVSKNRRKKNKRCINDLNRQLNILCNLSDNDEKSEYTLIKKESRLKRKRKKKESKSLMNHNIEDRKKEKVRDMDDTSFPVSQKLKEVVKEENIQDQRYDYAEEEYENVSSHKKKKKKSKRKKNQNDQNENTIHTWEDTDLNNTRAKKLKRAHKSELNLQYDSINMLDSKFQMKPSCNELSIKSHKIRNSFVYPEPLDTHFKHEANILNAKIKKKKRKKFCKKEEIKLSKITASLDAIHFDTEEFSEKRNCKKELNTIVEKMMEASIVTNETVSLKKLAKKKKSNK